MGLGILIKHDDDIGSSRRYDTGARSVPALVSRAYDVRERTASARLRLGRPSRLLQHAACLIDVQGRFPGRSRSRLGRRAPAHPGEKKLRFDRASM